MGVQELTLRSPEAKINVYSCNVGRFGVSAAMGAFPTRIRVLSFRDRASRIARQRILHGFECGEGAHRRIVTRLRLAEDGLCVSLRISLQV